MKDRVPISQPIVISCHSNMDVSTAFNKVWYKNPKGQEGYFDTPSWVIDKKKVRICVALPIPGRWKIRLVSLLSGVGKEYFSSAFFLDVFRQKQVTGQTTVIDTDAGVTGPSHLQLLQMLEAHINDANPHPQYTTNLEFILYQNFTNAEILNIKNSFSSGNIGYGTKVTGVDPGSLFQLSIDDDFLYVCVIGGIVPTAVWKRVALNRT